MCQRRIHFRLRNRKLWISYQSNREQLTPVPLLGRPRCDGLRQQPHQLVPELTIVESARGKLLGAALGFERRGLVGHATGQHTQDQSPQCRRQYTHAISLPAQEALSAILEVADGNRMCAEGDSVVPATCRKSDTR